MCRYLAVILLTLLFVGSSQDVEAQQSSPLDGTYLSVARTSQVTVTTVRGGAVEGSYNRDKLGNSVKALRPPCVSCPNSYNYFVARATGEVVIPDSNALHIVTREGSFKKTVQLPNCDPHHLGVETFDNFTIFVLCTPKGTEVALYEVDITRWQAVLLNTFVSDSPFVSESAVRFYRDGFHNVYLATLNGSAYATTANSEVRQYELANCERILRITDYLSALANTVLFECGNATTGLVQTVRQCSTEYLNCSDVVFPPNRPLGTLRFSENGEILVNVAPKRIDVAVVRGTEVSRIMGPIVAGSQQIFYDGYVETLKGLHTLIYADKGGKIYSYDISAALSGQSGVISNEIPGDYITCTDCSGLVRVAPDYCAMGTDRGGAWLSFTPPGLIDAKVGFDSQRMIFLPDPSKNEPPTDSAKSLAPSIQLEMSGGIAGGVTVVFLVAVACLIVVGLVVVSYRRHKTNGTTGGTPPPSARYERNNNQVHIDEDPSTRSIGSEIGLTNTFSPSTEQPTSPQPPSDVDQGRTMKGGDCDKESIPIQCTDPSAEEDVKIVVDLKLPTLPPTTTLEAKKSNLANKQSHL